ncbi:HIT-like domain-containing protein [Xylariales sp. PMI_506]|nr:HIT-like domain-containing protein [Xylariales sp. PMI_506]
MSPIRAPANLPSLVRTTFAKAKASGDLSYYPTQVTILELDSIAFQLRFSPALASKPKAPKPKVPGAKPFNPFESPLPSMTVAELGAAPSHVLVLNKFAIVPEHFILATRTVKPQTHVLERDDLEAAWACIRAYREDHDQELFVFFNSGPHSGASQPHRHLQLLPVERMRDGLDDPASWGVLVDRLPGGSLSSVQGGGGGGGGGQELPFTVLSEAIGPSTDLHEAYLGLYRRAVRLALPAGEKEDGELPVEGEAKISYNMAITNTHIAIMPRVAEGAPIQSESGEEDIGSIALNGTVLAGTALVKNQAEWDALRHNPRVLLDVLRQIGVPPKGRMSGNL